MNTFNRFFPKALASLMLAGLSFLAMPSKSQAQCPTGWNSATDITTVDGCSVTIAYCWRSYLGTNQIRLTSVTKTGSCSTDWTTLIYDSQQQVIIDDQMGWTYIPCNQGGYNWFYIEADLVTCWKIINVACGTCVPQEEAVICDNVSAKCQSIYAVCEPIVGGPPTITLTSRQLVGDSPCSTNLPTSGYTYDTCYAINCSN